jgi:hypothetical protein
MTEVLPLTLSVPEAGKRYFALSRNAAYAAAARGEISDCKDRTPAARARKGLRANAR